MPLLAAKDAVDTAKRSIGDLFASEGVFNLGLEELEYDEGQDRWHITIGFSRAWDKKQGALMDLTPLGRTYKVVVMDGEGKIISVRNREPANAG